MQKKLRVAAGQFAPVRGSISENMQLHEQLTARAASAGVNVLLFPELSLTGYEPELATERALRDEACLRPLQKLADEQDMTIIVGAPLQVNNSKPAIGALIISTQRPVSYYRKMHLHPGESDYFSCGSESCVFTRHQFNIGLAVCADAGNPTHVENSVRLGAEIYLNAVLSAGGYEKDAGLLQGYAAQYGVPTLMANYCGPSGGWQPVGKSAAWNAQGERIAQAPEARAALVIVDIQEQRCSAEVMLC